MRERTWNYYQREYVEKERSTVDIAAEQNTYPNRIRRELIDLGFALRGKSEAQRAALRHGRTQHPTAGRGHSDESRRKISRSIMESRNNAKKED